MALTSASASSWSRFEAEEGVDADAAADAVDGALGAVCALATWLTEVAED